MNIIMFLIEKGLIPDILIRFGIRYLVAQRLQEETNTFSKCLPSSGLVIPLLEKDGDSK